MKQPKHGHWTAVSHRILRDAFATFPRGLQDQHLRHRLVPFYPFGNRWGWPYKCWLRACRQWRQAYKLGMQNGDSASAHMKTPKDKATMELKL